MKRSLALVAVSVASLLMADAAAAQPPPYGRPPPPPAGYRPPPPARVQPYHYDNGRWVTPNEWNRRATERDRWVRSYERRHRDRDHGDSSALIAGIIGFALGAAIVGSMEQAEHARTADASWDAYCARKYRTYDPRSRTYLGYDGLRHYCQ